MQYNTCSNAMMAIWVDPYMQTLGCYRRLMPGNSSTNDKAQKRELRAGCEVMN